MKKKITHLKCPMNHEGLTKGKVYEVVEKVSDNLSVIEDDAGNYTYVIHREGWIPVEQQPFLDRTIFRNEWTAMGAIVFVLTLVLLICKLVA